MKRTGKLILLGTGIIAGAATATAAFYEVFGLLTYVVIYLVNTESADEKGNSKHCGYNRY